MDQQDPKTPDEKQKADDAAWDKVQQDRSTEAEGTGTTIEGSAAKVDDKPTDDPLAALPEPTRKLIESIKSENDARFKELNQKLATANGTVGGLKQQLDASRAELTRFKPVADKVEAADKAALEADAQKRSNAVKELRERLADFPDVLEYLDMVLPADAKPAEKPAEIEKPKPAAEVRQEPAGDDPNPERVKALRETLEEIHPGWEAEFRSKDFQGWLKKQPEAVQQQAESWSVKECSGVLTAFEKHKEDAATGAALEKERDDRVRRGESIQGRGGGTADAGDPESLWTKVSRDRAKERASA